MSVVNSITAEEASGCPAGQEKAVTAASFKRVRAQSVKSREDRGQFNAQEGSSLHVSRDFSFYIQSTGCGLICRES